MSNFIHIPRARVPQGRPQLAADPASNSFKSQVFQAHENQLHSHFSQTLSLEVKTSSLLYFWDAESIDEEDTGGGAALFNRMRQDCELVDADAHFALLLHTSIQLSFHLELGDKQGAFNRIIENRQSTFDEMQTEVFEFFGKQRKPVDHAEPQQPVQTPAPRFEEIPTTNRISEFQQAPQPEVRQPRQVSAPYVSKHEQTKAAWLKDNPAKAKSKPAAEALPAAPSRPASVESSKEPGGIRKLFSKMKEGSWRRSVDTKAYRLRQASGEKLAVAGHAVANAAKATGSGVKTLWDGVKHRLSSPPDRV